MLDAKSEDRGSTDKQFLAYREAYELAEEHFKGFENSSIGETSVRITVRDAEPEDFGVLLLASDGYAYVASVGFAHFYLIDVSAYSTEGIKPGDEVMVKPGRLVRYERKPESIIIQPTKLKDRSDPS